MDSTCSLEQTSATGNLDADLLLLQNKSVLMSLFMETKPNNRN